PPLTADNEYDHSGLVVVLTAVSLCLVLFSLAARTFSSYHRNSLQRDDYTFGALVVAAIVQLIIVFSEVHYGWGRRSILSTPRVKSKCSSIYCRYNLHYRSRPFKDNNLHVLRRSILPDTTPTLLCHSLDYGRMDGVIYVSVGEFAVLPIRGLRSLLLSAVDWYDFPLPHIGTLTNRLQSVRWEVITALDIFTEVLLGVYAGLAIHEVRISTQKKIVVFCALESRILLIPVAAVRLYYILAQLSSEDPTLIGSYATVTTEIYIGLSVLCLLTAFLNLRRRYGHNIYLSGPIEDGLKNHLKLGIAVENSTEGCIVPQAVSRDEGERGMKGWEREEDPIMGSPEGAHGLQIMKTVQLSVRDESIELSERG
ncbi:hypothetical protein N7454_007002, partial [Penicillium verhagenii]